MNLSLPHIRLNDSVASPHHHHGRDARLRSLVSLFALYSAVLLTVILISDGADIGCILAGIAGHVLFASGKTALAWREASWFEEARVRVAERRCAFRFARARY